MNVKKILPIIGIVIFIYILWTLDKGEIIAVFAAVNPLYSLLAFFSIVPIVLFSTYQWQLVLRKQKIKVTPWYSLKNIFIGYFYGFITPGGYGAYTRAFYLREKSDAPLPKCVSNILIFNTIDYLSLLCLAVVGGVLLSSRFPVLLYVVLGILTLVIILYLLFFRKQTGSMLVKKIVQSRANPFKRKLNISIDAFYEDLPTVKDLLFPFFVSVVGWIVRFSEFFAISKLFTVDVPYLYFIFIIPVANIIASLPVSIYGLGTREMTLIAVFSTFAVLPEKILSLSLFWFVLVWVFPSVIGAVVTLFEGKKGKKIPLSFNS